MTNDFPVSVRTDCVCLNLLVAASKRECLQHKASDSESRELDPGFLTAHPARCSPVGVEEQTPCCRSHKASTVGSGTLYNVFIISLVKLHGSDEFYRKSCCTNHLLGGISY